MCGLCMDDVLIMYGLFMEYACMIRYGLCMVYVPCGDYVWIASGLCTDSAKVMYGL